MFGFVSDSTQIGPGKTLDSSVGREHIGNLLTLLNATSRSIAKKDIATSMAQSYGFLEKLAKDYATEAVRDFHRYYILLYVPHSFVKFTNALSRILVGRQFIGPIS